MMDVAELVKNSPVCSFHVSACLLIFWLNSAKYDSAQYFTAFVLPHHNDIFFYFDKIIVYVKKCINLPFQYQHWRE